MARASDLPTVLARGAGARQVNQLVLDLRFAVSGFPISCPGVRGKFPRSTPDTATSDCHRPLTISPTVQVAEGGCGGAARA